MENVIHVYTNIHIFFIRFEGIKDIDTWSDKMKQPMIEVYGEEYFRSLMSDWVDTMERIYEKNKGDLCKNVLAKIKCPTLIIHGAKDLVVKPEHPVYLKDHIKNSEYAHIFLYLNIQLL